MKNNKTSLKERNKTADLLKGLAVIFMIQVHITELFLSPEIYQSTAGKISLFLGGPPAAPVFMAVMGYFLFLSRKSWIENIERGIKLFIGGILLNIGLNFHLLIKIYNGDFDINPWQYVFGADILTLAGLSIITLAVLKKIFHSNLIPYVIGSFLVLILSHSLREISYSPDSVLNYIQAFFYGTMEWSYFPFIPWFIYPLAGFIFAIISKEYSHLLKNKILLPVVVFSGLIVLYTFEFSFDISGDLQLYYHHNEIFVLWVFAFLIVWTFCLNYLLEKTGKNILPEYIEWLGKNVTSAYVFQWLIIGNIATSIYKTQSLLYSIYWFVGIMIIVSLLIYLYTEYFPEKLKFYLKLFSF